MTALNPSFEWDFLEEDKSIGGECVFMNFKIMKNLLCMKDSVFYLMIFLFIVSLAILLNESCFYKYMFCYPDELVYIHMNESIFRDISLQVWGMPSKCTKVFYSLILGPAYFFEGTKYYPIAISVINSLLMATMVPLTYWIAKICSLNKFHTVLLLIFSVIMPDLAYSMTFMSENVYLPLGTATICIAWKSIDALLHSEKTYWHYILLAVSFFCLYLAKEVGILFVAGYFASILYLIRKKVICNDLIKRIVYTRVGVLCLTLAALYLFFKIVVFSGIVTTYDDFLSTFRFRGYESVQYFFNSSFVSGVWILIAYFIFPIVGPILLWKRMEETMKWKYIFLLTTLLSIWCIVNSVIYMIENFGVINLRNHLRYYCPLFLPFLAVFLSTAECAWKKYEPTKGYWIFLGALVLVVGFGLKLPLSVGSVADETMLAYAVYLPYFFHDRFGIPVEYAESVTLFLRIFIICLLLIFGGGFIKKTKKALYIMLVVMASICLLNRAAVSYIFSLNYSRILNPVEEKVDHLFEFVHSEPDILGNTVYMCTWREYGWKNSGFLDLYFPNKVYYTALDDALAVWGATPRTVSLDNSSMKPTRYLLTDKISDAFIDTSRLRYVGMCLDGLRLYEKQDKNSLPWKPSPLVFWDGWHEKEEWGYWSKSTSSEIWVKMPEDKTGVMLHMVSFGQDTDVVTFANGKALAVLKLEAGKEIQIVLRSVPKDGMNYTKIIFKNQNGSLLSPKELGVNDDGRKLGIGLKNSIQFLD